LNSIEQIEESMREAEQRHSSAPLLIEYLGKRVRDLTERNEELLSENIELRMDKKVEEYEKRIANLEYQLAMIKRQLSNVDSESVIEPREKAACLILYHPNGRLLRINTPNNQLDVGTLVGKILGEVSPGELPPRLIATIPSEELLVVFDSGRTEAFPVEKLPVCDTGEMDWKKGRLVEPHGNEELTFVLPIARMSLYDYCIQISRRGCAKRMMKSSFEAHVAKKYVGTGVKQKPDRTCTLTFANKTDRLIIATYEGFFVSHSVEALSFTTEEAMRLAASDHVISAFPAAGKTILAITTDGKVLQRESEWLEPAESFRSKGQAFFSQSRRDAGHRCAAAACIDDGDWVAILLSDGQLITSSTSDLLAAGAVREVGQNAQVIDFAGITPPNGNS